jgi:8-oxo-dGTP pyrophosphatase MutT (NUDIX family)
MPVQPILAETPCVRLATCAFRVAHWTWPLAKEKADEIARDWQRRRAQTPEFFNGAVYLMCQHAIEGDALCGTFFKTDFATFLYWREQPAAEAQAVHEGFGASLIRSAEGYVLLGRQAPGQLNSGRVYPPSGVIDDGDVCDGAIDIDANIRRELAEETGLDGEAVQRQPGYIVALLGRQIAIGVEWRSALPALELRARILAFTRAQSVPELDDVVIVRSQADIDESTMPRHARVFVGALLPA